MPFIIISLYKRGSGGSLYHTSHTQRPASPEHSLLHLIRALSDTDVNLLRDIRAAVDWYGGAEGGRIWLEAPQSQPQADARARALIELEHLLSFWGAAADGIPEEARAEACYEVAMGHNGLNEGAVAIIQSYLQKEDHEN